MHTNHCAVPIPHGYTDRDRALDGDSRLDHLDGLAWHLVIPAVAAGVSDGDAAWALLKLAANPLLGFERGSVTLADEVPTMWILDRSTLLHRSRTVDPDTDAERFLRSSTAWDAVTRPWLDAIARAENGRSSRPPARRRREPTFASPAPRVTATAHRCDSEPHEESTTQSKGTA